MPSPTLFVTWRSPKTRAVLPVARIVFHPDRGLYEFAYIRAAERAREQGFLPFVEFPDLLRAYQSVKPFPLLANRLMPPGRPDHAGFLTSLGLPLTAHPMQILARTGGQRTTDQIALFPMPTPDGSGCYLTYCLVQAIRYMPQPATEERVARLRPGDKLLMMGDVQNQVDPQAIALRTEDNYMVGYLPAYLAADAWKLTTGCGTLNVHVERVNPTPAEIHHRLLVRIMTCWPDDFRPYSDEKFQPLATG
jgi:hypothetical protein